MVFWLIASVLTLASCLAVLLPFLRPNVTADTGAAHDREVYRDQLAELDRDLERGLIGPEEARQARTEIGRRLLAISDSAADPAGRRIGRGARIAMTAAILSVPVVSWSVYAVIGSPRLPDQPLEARLQRNPADSSVEELIAQAEHHLRRDPSDVRGWDVLAPIYARQRRFPEAATAYRNAIRLGGATAPREAGLGEALAGAAGGMVTSDAQSAFQRALALDAANGKARFFIALGYRQEGRDDESRAVLEKMIADLPATDPWHMTAAEALGRVSQPATPAVSGEDIEKMVAGLDDRLRREPADPEGWQRLVRSYVVLGRAEAARDALSRGVAALGDDADGAQALMEAARQLGVERGTP